MKTALGYILAGLAALVVIGGLTWFSLGMNRVAAPFAEETSRLTESNSRRRIDGVNAGIVSLCLNMRTAPDDASKRAFASMITTEADSFQRQDLLTSQARACRAEADAALAAPAI